MAIYKQPGSSVWSYDSTVDGRRYWGTTKESSKTAALAIEADFRNKAREKGPNFVPLRRSKTLRELSKRFLEWKDTAQLEAKTRRYYEYGWKLLASSSLASLQLTRITTDEVKAVRLVGLLGKPIGGQYANQAIRTLRVMLHNAREWRLIPEVPMLKLSKAAGRQLLLSAENEAGILKHASEDVQDVFIRIEDPGMRPNEVLQTQWSDVSFNEDLDLCPRVKNGGCPPQGTDFGAPEATIVGAEEAREIDLGLPRTTRRGPPQVGREELQNARGKAGVDKVLYIARHTFWALCSGGIAEPTGGHENDGTRHCEQHTSLSASRHREHSCSDRSAE